MAKQFFELNEVQSQIPTHVRNWEIVANKKKVTVIHKRGGHTVDYKKTFPREKGRLTLTGGPSGSFAYVRTETFQNYLDEFNLTGILPMSKLPTSIENFDFGTSHGRTNVIGVKVEDYPVSDFDIEDRDRRIRSGGNPRYCDSPIRSKVIIDENTRWVIVETDMDHRDNKRKSRYLYLKKGLKIEDILDELRK